jgi:hypothetical protein
VRKLRRLSQGRYGLGGPGSLKQRLAFEFIKIRIVGLDLD